MHCVSNKIQCRILTSNRPSEKWIKMPSQEVCRIMPLKLGIDIKHSMNSIVQAQIHLMNKLFKFLCEHNLMLSHCHNNCIM